MNKVDHIDFSLANGELVMINEKHKKWNGMLVDANKIISRCERVIIHVDYPLGAEFTFDFYVGLKRELTKLRFCQYVRQIYRQIYKKPEKYQIWGHTIDDLSLSGATRRKSKKVEFDLLISS